MICNITLIVCMLNLLLLSSVKNVNALTLSKGTSKAAMMFGTRAKATRLSMATDMTPVRVRFAPSPTGSLHVGGARTALYNWLLARKTNGKFIIRVEDTDEARSTRESEASILSDLRWMNMDWDEGPEIDGPHSPYRQSERKDIYKVQADKLLASGAAYRCFCTPEELDTKRAAAEAKGEDPKYDGVWRDRDAADIQAQLDAGTPFTVRFKVPPGKIVSIDDRVRGRVSWDAEATLGDFIVLRSNGMPVYNFCVSVDDAEMKITHVIRAEEHLTNTVRQMLVLEALDYTPPTYAHCSLILGSDRQKMSKRHGATSVQQFSEQGFVPDAMMNYLANLGWNDGTDKEIYTPEELISAFDLNRIVKTPAMFDMEKLKWVNKQHLSSMPLDKLRPLVLDRLINCPDAPIVAAAVDSPAFDAFLSEATKIAQRDMELTTEATRLVGNCLQYDLQAALASGDKAVGEMLAKDDGAGFQKVLDRLLADAAAGALPTGAEDNFSELWKPYMKALAKELALKGKDLFHPVRLCLTGRMSGPDVGDQLRLLALAGQSGAVLPAYPLTSLSDRLAALSAFSIADALKVVEAAAAAPAAAV